jgi:hypothetical protein
MTWLSAVPAILAAVVVLLGPGLLIAWILRLRGIWLWGFAGPASVSVIVIGSVLTPLVGIRWSMLAYAGSALVLAVVALVLRLTVLRTMPPAPAAARFRSRRSMLIAGGLVLGGVLIAVQLALMIGVPDNISQTFDNVFHLNAVRFVIDTGSASPFHVGQMTGDAVWFYPAGWHGAVALVDMLSGASIPVATNAVVLVTAAIVWPASIVLLTRVLTGGRAWVDAAAGVLAAGLPAFPFLPVDYGVLYPYLLALAILPPTVAASIVAFRLGRSTDTDVRPVVLVLLGSLPGLAFAHPGGFIAWMMATMLCAVFAFVLLVRRAPSRRTLTVASVVFGLSVVLVAIAIFVLRPDEAARGWLPVGSVGQAAGEALFLSPHYASAPLAVAVLFWVGAFAALRRRGRADILAVALFAIVAALYIVAQSLPWLTIRDLITGPWYNDAVRLAALLPMVAIPLASLGAVIAAGLVAKAWSVRRLTTGAVLIVVVAGLAVFQVHSAIVTIRVGSESYYQYPDEAPLLSEDEAALLERLPSEVGEDDVIAGNPWTGASLAYAFADRRVLMPHILMDFSADEDLINEELRNAVPGAPVCDALDRTGVDYVLDFGDLEVHGGEHPAPGLEQLSRSDAVQLVDSEGSARLYKVIGCEE